MKKIELKGLQAEIKGLAEAARAFNPRIQAAKGLERHHLRGEKHSASGYSRELLLAYGMLRGLPYEVIERKTREGNSPWVKKIHEICVRFNPEVAVDDVTKWLERPAAVVQEAAE